MFSLGWKGDSGERKTASRPPPQGLGYQLKARMAQCYPEALACGMKCDQKLLFVCLLPAERWLWLVQG